ncbi:GNAT family N-acetyltransferase [Terasakiella pusilla]|uniref:GNAT family N-acetyltransferase n=1 Tax=Terasakiella pusilla TaxID=64973 RepID=UPI003AA90BC2
MMSMNGITLGPVEERDIPVLYDWINDPDLIHLSSTYKPVHEVQHIEWFNSLSKASDRVIFAIRNEAGDLVGTIQLVNIHPVFRHAELIVRIGDTANQSRGYGSAALRLLLEYAKRDLNLKRIFLHVFASNMRAIKAYENVGMQKEGCLRSHVYIDGQWDDLLIMGCLLDE